jgi:hypothetical protein
METVDGVWGSEFGVEEGVNLFWVAQVGFSGNDMFSSLRGLWLDNISQDEVNIGCSGIRE